MERQIGYNGYLMIIICTESSSDFSAIARLNREVHGRDDEAQLVEKLRASGAPVLSLVAKEDGQVLGHALFVPVTIEGSPLKGIGLGPLSVPREQRKREVDSLLIKAGLASCRDEGYGFAVVTGEPEFYARFGFELAGNLGLRSKLPAPDGAFLARALQPGALQGTSGLVCFLPEFEHLEG